MVRFNLKKLAQSLTLISIFLFYSLLLVSLTSHNQSDLIVLEDTQVQLPSSLSSSSALLQNVKNRYKTSFQERVPRSIESDYSLSTVQQNSSSQMIQFNHSTTSKIKKKKFKYLKNKMSINLKDIFISVKTTKSFHNTRLDLILKTWFNLAKDQTYFFTDSEDDVFQKRTNGHLINTNCSSSHNRKALCCKMNVEFDTFLKSNKKWFCHFDDDNYVNIPCLVKLLKNYPSSQDWYIGKPSIRSPLELLSRDSQQVAQQSKISFWFATGGAGLCISRTLALKMKPFASGGNFIAIGEKIRLPDDVTIGYIIEYLLNKKLTVVNEFHSHLEPMKFIKLEKLSEQITFSYSKYGQEMNVVNLKNKTSLKKDPTRFLSLHCHLTKSC